MSFGLLCCAIVTADMKGIKPEWPSVTSVLNLAANSFRRLKSTGEWDNVSGNRSRAFMTHPMKSIPENTSKPVPRKLICWNCGDGHHLKDCKKPKDQKKIELARSKFRPRGNRRFQPQGRRDDKSNKPFNQNHRRAYLLEQGKRRVKGAHATPGDRAPPAEVNQVDKITEQEANVAVRAGAVRSALRNRCMLPFSS